MIPSESTGIKEEPSDPDNIPVMAYEACALPTQQPFSLLSLSLQPAC